MHEVIIIRFTHQMNYSILSVRYVDMCMYTDEIEWWVHWRGYRPDNWPYSLHYIWPFGTLA